MPTGAHREILTLARNTIADCTHFRSWNSNTFNQAQARDRIYYGGLPRPANNQDEHSLAELKNFRPFAILWNEVQGGSAWTHNAMAGSGAGARYYTPSGTLTVMFEREVTEENPDDNALIETNMVAEMALIMSSDTGGDSTMTTLGGLASYLPWTSMQGDGPYRSEPNHRTRYGDYLRYYMTFDWGPVQ